MLDLVPRLPGNLRDQAQQEKVNKECERLAAHWATSHPDDLELVTNYCESSWSAAATPPG